MRLDTETRRGSGEGRWRKGEMTPVVLRGKLITIRHFEYVSEKSGETKSLS